MPILKDKVGRVKADDAGLDHGVAVL